MFKKAIYHKAKNIVIEKIRLINNHERDKVD